MCLLDDVRGSRYPGTFEEPVEEKWFLSEKRNEACHKQAFAVSRLECERRSTPTQQINDWRYLLHSDPRLAAIVGAGSYVMSLADLSLHQLLQNLP